MEVHNIVQETVTKLYKKDINELDNPNGVVIHLEPDILKCEVKWVLGGITMNKSSGGVGIPAVLFHTLKADAVKVLHLICQQIWKGSVFIPILKKNRT